MSASRRLDELPKKVADELKETALRVSQGLPAVQALKTVLTDHRVHQPFTQSKS